MPLCMSIAILSTLHFGASLKVDNVAGYGSLPSLEAHDGLDKTKSGSDLVSGGMSSLANVLKHASLTNAFDQIPEVKAHDSLTHFSENKEFSATAKLHSAPLPTMPNNDPHVAVKNPVATEGSHAAAHGPQSAVQIVETVTPETKVVAKKQIARGRGSQSDAPEPDISPWLPFASWVGGSNLQGEQPTRALVVLLVIGIVASLLACWSILHSQCGQKDDSILEEAWKPKQVTLRTEAMNPLTALANDTVASVNAAINAAAKLAVEIPEEPPKKNQPGVAPRYSQRHVPCPWPSEPESPTQEEEPDKPREATPEQPPRLLSSTPTVAKVKLNDELGAWIPDVKDVVSELGDDRSHEDSTSAGDSEQALMDKLREVASDGEDVSPRHLQRCGSEENLDVI